MALAIGISGHGADTPILSHYQRGGVQLPFCKDLDAAGQERALQKRLRDWKVVPDSVTGRLSRQLEKAKRQCEEELEDKTLFPYQIMTDEEKVYLNTQHPQAYHEESYMMNAYDVGVVGFQGARLSMEDAHCAVALSVEIQGRSYPVQLYGVFDGHSGQDVASCVAAYLPNYLKRELEEQNKNGLSDQGIWNALNMSMVRLNNDLPKLLPREGAAPLGENAKSQGTCVTMVMILDGKLWTANVGDSRIVIDNNGTPIQMTEDAKLSNSKYRDQVVKRGGAIIRLDTDRVNANLAVARALGDHGLDGAISPRPKITMISLSELHPNHQIILCCDGVFDVASTRQVVARASEHKYYDDASKLARNLVNSAYKANSRDNLSCIVVRHIQAREMIAPAPFPTFNPLPPSAPEQSMAFEGSADSLPQLACWAIAGTSEAAAAAAAPAREEALLVSPPEQVFSAAIPASAAQQAPQCMLQGCGRPAAPKDGGGTWRSCTKAHGTELAKREVIDRLFRASGVPKCMLQGCDKAAAPNSRGGYWRCCSQTHAGELKQREQAEQNPQQDAAAAAAGAVLGARAPHAGVFPAPAPQAPPAPAAAAGSIKRGWGCAIQ